MVHPSKLVPFFTPAFHALLSDVKILAFFVHREHVKAKAQPAFVLVLLCCCFTNEHVSKFIAGFAGLVSLAFKAVGQPLCFKNNRFSA